MLSFMMANRGGHELDIKDFRGMCDSIYFVRNFESTDICSDSIHIYSDIRCSDIHIFYILIEYPFKSLQIKLKKKKI